MSQVREPVGLPEHRGTLLHPWEVPAARRSYLTAMALEWLCSPAVFCCAVLVLLAVSNNAVTPLPSAIVTIGIVAILERHHRTEAWAHIPRSRQDTSHHDPTAASVAGAISQVALLGVALSFFTHMVASAHVQAGAVALGTGVALGTAALTAGTAVWDLSPRRALRAGHAHPIVALPTAALVAMAVLAACASWPTAGDAAILMAVGAAFAAAMQITCWMLRLIPAHASCGLPALLDRLAAGHHRRLS